jgi:acylphosphatase
MEETDNKQQLRAVVSGRVQGVSFRYYTEQRARQLGLVGHVRNLPDGTVEVVAEGDRRALQSLLLWLHRGPRMAIVEEVRETWGEPTGRYRRFAAML